MSSICWFPSSLSGSLFTVSKRKSSGLSSYFYSYLKTQKLNLSLSRTHFPSPQFNHINFQTQLKPKYVSKILRAKTSFSPGKVSGIITSLPIIGGITASGVFLLFVSVVGIIGAMRQHQVMLFTYMIVLFFVFVIQFSCSCAALSVSEEDQRTIIFKVNTYSYRVKLTYIVLHCLFFVCRPGRSVRRTILN